MQGYETEMIVVESASDCPPVPFDAAIHETMLSSPQLGKSVSM